MKEIAAVFDGKIFHPTETITLPANTRVKIFILRSTSTGWQDNHSCAVKNQPLLEEALRKCEKQVGKPIVEWNSRYYCDQIFKYGFKGLKNKH